MSNLRKKLFFALIIVTVPSTLFWASHTSAKLEDQQWELTQKQRKRRLKMECEVLSQTPIYNSPTLHLLSEGKTFQPNLNNLFVDEEHKVLYCYIPKVACTQWKKVMMVLTGSSTVEGLTKITHRKAHFHNKLKALVPSVYKKKEIMERLKTYKKFLIVRHPVERLLSAYRDKFVAKTSDANMFRKSHAAKMMAFARNTSHVPQSGVGMTFQEFLFYLTAHPPIYFQEHWASYVHLCHPCTIDYDFIGAYETLQTDSNHILRMIGAPSNLIFPPFKPSNTSKDLAAVLQTIPAELLQKVFTTYLPDYTLFGYEKIPRKH